MRNYKISEYGRSMIEILGVLSIVGVLSVAGISGYYKGMTKYKTNQLLDQISTIANNIKIIMSGENTQYGLSIEALFKLKILPESMIKTCAYPYSSCIKHAFNSTASVYTGGISVGSTPVFCINVNNIPQEACAAIAMTDWDTYFGNGQFTIEVVGGRTTHYFGHYNGLTAAQDCGVNNNIRLCLKF